jgi:PmbA protein
MDLASPEAVGRYAAERALSRLKGRKVPTCEVPVLFENTLAAGLLGAGAGHQRRRALPQGQLPAGQPGQAVLAEHIDIDEDPHVPRARAARPSTTRACARARKVVEAAWCRATSCPATRRASWA